MAVLDFDGLAWLEAEAPFESIENRTGYAKRDGRNATLTLQDTPFGPGINVARASRINTNGADIGGTFGRLQGEYTADITVAFLISGDFESGGGLALGFGGLENYGGSGSYSSRGFGGLGFVCLEGRIGLGERVYRQNIVGDSFIEDLVSRPPAWVEGSPNTVYVKRIPRGPGFLYELYVNDSEMLTSLYSENNYPLIGAVFNFYPPYSPNVYPSGAFSLPILCTQPEGRLSFKQYYPSADGPSTFTPKTGEEGFSQINETVPDGDASYVTATETESFALYGYRDAKGRLPDIQEQQAVLSCKQYLAARVDGSARRSLSAIAGGVNRHEKAPGKTEIIGAYTEGSVYMPQNPLTGEAWQGADFKDTMIGFEINEDS